jgi:hypothetical protein
VLSNEFISNILHIHAKAWDVAAIGAKKQSFYSKSSRTKPNPRPKLKMKNIAIIMEAIPANIKFHLIAETLYTNH